MIPRALDANIVGDVRLYCDVFAWQLFTLKKGCILFTSTWTHDFYQIFMHLPIRLLKVCPNGINNISNHKMAQQSGKDIWIHRRYRDKRVEIKKVKFFFHTLFLLSHSRHFSTESLGTKVPRVCRKWESGKGSGKRNDLKKGSEGYQCCYIPRIQQTSY